MKIFLASPFAPTPSRSLQDNVDYAKGAMLHSIRRGEAPFVPHLLYPMVLREPEDRALAASLSFHYLLSSSLLAVYCDHGISDGMKEEMALAKLHFIPVVFRLISTEGQRMANEWPANIQRRASHE